MNMVDDNKLHRNIWLQGRHKTLILVVPIIGPNKKSIRTIPVTCWPNDEAGALFEVVGVLKPANV